MANTKGNPPAAEAARAAVRRAEAGDGHDLERHLRGERLRNGWLHTVPVRGKNGEAWSVPGLPMDPGQAPGLYEAIDTLESIHTSRGPARESMKAAFEVAYLILREAYPRLTRRVAHLHVLDAKTAARIEFAAMHGQAPPGEQEAEIQRVARAVAWCMANKAVANTPEKIAELIVRGIPEEEGGGEDPKNSL